MLILGAVFAFYAARHPEMSFPLDAARTKTIYRLYFVIMLIFLIWPFGGGRKRRKKRKVD